MTAAARTVDVQATLPARTAVLVFTSFAFAYFLSALVRAVTATLAPSFSAELGLTSGDLGLLAGAYFLGFAAAFTVIAMWACRHHIRPNMLTAHVTRNHMIHRQTVIAPAAILTGIIITTKDLAAR